MRVFIAGQQLFGAEVFALCLRLNLDVVGVCSPSLSSLGGPDRLRSAATAGQIPWVKSGSLRPEDIPASTDLIVGAHCHDYIGQAVRSRARLGALGYHPSLLPIHRGRDAIAWSLRFRERVTGGTVYWMDDGADTGEVAAQRHVFIRPDDTPAGLWRRALMPLGLELLGEVLTDLKRGVVRRLPQDDTLATWEPSLDREPLGAREMRAAR